MNPVEVWKSSMSMKKNTGNVPWNNDEPNEDVMQFLRRIAVPREEFERLTREEFERLTRERVRYENQITRNA